VRIKRGEGHGKHGVVFWLGDGRGGARCGVRTDGDGATVWVDAVNVELVVDTPDAPPRKPATATKKRPIVDDDDEAPTVPAKQPDEAPTVPSKKPKRKADQSPADKPADKLAFAKGSQVRWAKGRHSGTGAVFWIGQNKFGDGMRVGVKDDETGETVWADAADCSPKE
jgi:hypothetical protein